MEEGWDAMAEQELRQGLGRRMEAVVDVAAAAEEEESSRMVGQSVNCCASVNVHVVDKDESARTRRKDAIGLVQ